MKIPNIKKSGIYKILNTVNGKFYVGSAKSIYNRIHLHKSKILNGSHPNKHLLSSINKYGIDNFQIEILALCPIEYLIKLEQWFIDNLKPQYNKRQIANSNIGIKLSEERKNKLRLLRLGSKLTDEHKKKIGEASHNRIWSIESRIKSGESSKGKPKSEKAKEKMKLAKLGKPSGRKGFKFSEESKEKMRISKLGNNNRTKNKSK